MGDIIERLRFYSTREKLGAPDLFSDAADEIERLRTQLAPHEALPEDVAAMKGRLYQTFIDASACALADGNRNWDAVARLVLSDRQRAVEAALRTLLIFRAFVQKNAAVWAIGSGHHHPVWQMVAETLSAARLNDETVDHALIRAHAQEG